ncbi:Predicted PurR-regulated permease PerM [Flavobacteriaceae bacterium MAR_2010_188]|nr:Predicted PurR-regulated permease PerM [Flavobacteriaceae bacterium MAR_2010_188]
MNSKIIANGILRAVAILLGLFILIYVILELSSVIVYISIAAVLSLIGRPIILFLRRRLKFNKLLAVILTILLMLAVFVGIIGLFIPLIIDQGHNLSLLDIRALEANIQYIYEQVMSYLNLDQLNFQESMFESNLIDNVDYGLIPDFLNGVISGLGSFSMGLFSVLFITFFFLKDSNMFQSIILSLVPDESEFRVRRSINTIKNLLSRYFVGLILQLSILFVIYTIVLLIVGIPNAIVIAFLCALLNIVPYLGPIISAGVMIVLTMTSNIGQDFSSIILPKTIWVMIGFMIGQLIDNFFSQPYIFSKSVKSHPLEIFLVIIIAGVLFGIIGMIIAVPAYTVIKVILKEFLNDYKIVKRLTSGLDD